VRECVDCGASIGIRATRCKRCRRIHRTRKERDRVAAQRESRADDSAPDYSPESTAVGRDMLERDYTIPGSAAKPPSFDVHPKQPRTVRRDEDVITDGRTPSPAERWAAQHQRSLDGIPNSIRRDRVRLEQVLAAQQSGGEDGDPEMTSWDELQGRNARQADDRMVSFPALGGDRSAPVITNPAAAGQLYPTAPPIRRPQQGPGRVPHIVN
jgi:hypothetical protein